MQNMVRCNGYDMGACNHARRQKGLDNPCMWGEHHVKRQDKVHACETKEMCKWRGIMVKCE
jgi:hypothetical protein